MLSRKRKEVTKRKNSDFALGNINWVEPLLTNLTVRARKVDGCSRSGENHWFLLREYLTKMTVTPLETEKCQILEPRSGLEPETSSLPWMRSTNWAIAALLGILPYEVRTSKPYCLGSWCAHFASIIFAASSIERARFYQWSAYLI